MGTGLIVLEKWEFELPSIEEQDILCKKVWAAYRLKQEYEKLLASTDELVKSQFIGIKLAIIPYTRRYFNKEPFSHLH